MAVNITQIGVDKPSGSPLITRKRRFDFNGDVETTEDFLYYLGTNLGSSSWRNPDNTEFFQANRLQAGGGVVPNDAANLIDNSADTTYFSAETQGNIGAEFIFSKNFTVQGILINGSSGGWIFELSTDNGNNFSNVSLTSPVNLGNNWSYYSTQYQTSNANIYRIKHGQEGVAKNLNSIKIFGYYQTGDFAPNKEDNTLILNCDNEEGSIYLPDANAENYPDDFYFEVFNLYDNIYNIVSIQGSTTTVVNNTTKPLTKGDKYIFVYNSNQWNIFKVGATPNLGSKGALLSQDGLEPITVPPGISGQTLVRDDATPSGLNWVNLSINNQLFNPIITSNFVLDNPFNNRLLPIDTTNGDVLITLATNLQPGFQVIIYHYGGGKVTIDPNGQVYRARGNTILNSNAAITLSFDLATNTWYGIGDLVQE